MCDSEYIIKQLVALCGNEIEKVFNGKRGG